MFSKPVNHNEQYTCQPQWTVHLSTTMNSTPVNHNDHQTCQPQWTVHLSTTMNSTPVNHNDHQTCQPQWSANLSTTMNSTPVNHNDLQVHFVLQGCKHTDMPENILLLLKWKPESTSRSQKTGLQLQAQAWNISPKTVTFFLSLNHSILTGLSKI